jgi:hypothetical protein
MKFYTSKTVRHNIDLSGRLAPRSRMHDELQEHMEARALVRRSVVFAVVGIVIAIALAINY